MPTACIGTATLFIADRAVKEFREMKTQMGKFALTGEGLNIGRDGSAPVTDGYPNGQLWTFRGGAIRKVIVDVSGEAYLDLEKEVVGMMRRE